MTTVLEIPRERVSPRAGLGNYYPQLDGIRAIAVIGVLLQHWTGIFSRLDTGGLGVRVFFVLSGFLITGILLRCRESARPGVSLKEHLGQFYMRRFLRIFPLYYVYLILIISLVPVVRAHCGWYFAYLTNFYVVKAGDFPPYVGHCWSLSVEEQFYLLWPLLILTIPRGALKPAIVLTAAGGVVSRVVVAGILGAASTGMVTLPMANLDSLGLGALLALLVLRGEASARVSRLGFWIGVPAMLLFHFPLTVHLSKTFFAICEPLSDAAFAFWLVDFGRRGPANLLGRTLNLAPLRYLGSISYGIYVWHYAVAPVTDHFLGRTSSIPGVFARVCINFAASIAIAALSWHLFEHPINNLKRFFPYSKRPGNEPATIPAARSGA